MVTIILARGLPGAGKTTLANAISMFNVAADDYQMDNGVYNWRADRVQDAHKQCLERTRTFVTGLMALDEIGVFETPDPVVVVHNTFTREWEMQPYFDLAKELGCNIFSIIVENRQGHTNQHGVPEEQIAKMQERFEVVLR